MAEMGKAMMGTGEAEGENRAIRAAEAAINNPLLEDTSMAGARGLLINITGGEDLTLFEVDQAANRIREEVDEEANVIFGSAVDEGLTGRIRVSVVATGIDSHKLVEQPRPKLVAVGGGGAVPAPQPIVRNGAAVAMAPAVVASTVASPLRQVSPQAEAVADVVPIMEAPKPLPVVQLAAKANLFAESQRPVAMPAGAGGVVPEAARPSLFSAVTGALRRRGATTAPAPTPTVRREPEMADHQSLGPQMRQTSAAEETGMEIPAFLRRQHS
jgi:cell division protein FtsZ